MRKPKPAKHAIPADWIPSQALIDYASEHGYSEHEALFIGHKVVTHFSATGEQRAGWDATYRNWVTRETPRQVKAAAAQWRHAAVIDWKARVSGWLFDRYWHESWGDPPDSPGYRGPPIETQPDLISLAGGKA